MGECKSNMKTSNSNNSSNSSNEKTTSLFGLIPPRKKADKGSNVELYGECITKADQKLQNLIAIKTTELTSEKGCELSNSLKLGNLKNQQMHIDAIIDLMHEYEGIK